MWAGIVSFFSAAVGALGKYFGWKEVRAQQQTTATDESRGAIAQAAKDNEISAQVATAEGQAVTDTPADAEGLAKIADKGKW